MKTNALTQLSTELQHWIDSAQSALAPALQKQLKRLTYRIDGAKGWLLGGAGLLLLWIWIWQWVLSIAVGLVVMVGVYLAQQGQLKLNWRGWRKLWSHSNRSLSFSVLAGIVALGSTYLATAVWLESDRHWLATSILLEGFWILAIGCLLLWQLFNRQFKFKDQEDQQFQRVLADLSHPDPLKRLIAVRQATHCLLSTSDHPALPMTASQLADCFRLMLDRETESLVCQALIESMQTLSPRQIAGTQLASVTIKTAIKTLQPSSLED